MSDGTQEIPCIFDLAELGLFRGSEELEYDEDSCKWESEIVIPRLREHGFEVIGEFFTLRSLNPTMRAIWVRRTGIKSLTFYLSG